MNEDSHSYVLVQIGLFSAMVAILVGMATYQLDSGLLKVLSIGITYVFGINAILLLGYEIQERASGLLGRS